MNTNLSIMSFNVRVWTRDIKKDSPHYWVNRMKLMKQMILDYNPHIICFQEMIFPANLFIPKEYKRINISIHHPIYVKRNLKISKHRFLVHLESIVINNEYQIINVHSHWNSDILKKNCQQIYDLSKNQSKVIICGDFNNDEKDIIYMDNCFKHVNFSTNDDTFENFNRPTESHGVIDHFYLKGIDKHSDVDIITEYGKISDHYPIFMEIFV